MNCRRKLPGVYCPPRMPADLETMPPVCPVICPPDERMAPVPRRPEMMPMPSVPQTMCFQLAHAYVPWQHYTPPFFSPAEGLAKGTIFPELWQPYTPRTKR